MEMPGGKSLLIYRLSGISELIEVPLNAGHTVASGIQILHGLTFTTSSQWIYFVRGDGKNPHRLVRARRLTDEPELVREIRDHYVDDPIAISPDDREMVFSAGGSRPLADLMLVRRFR